MQFMFYFIIINELECYYHNLGPANSVLYSMIFCISDRELCELLRALFSPRIQ